MPIWQRRFPRYTGCLMSLRYGQTFRSCSPHAFNSLGDVSGGSACDTIWAESSRPPPRTFSDCPFTTRSAERSSFALVQSLQLLFESLSFHAGYLMSSYWPDTSSCVVLSGWRKVFMNTHLRSGPMSPDRKS